MSRAAVDWTDFAVMLSARPPQRRSSKETTQTRILTNLYNTRLHWFVDPHAAFASAVAAAYGRVPEIVDRETSEALLEMNRKEIQQ